MRKWMLYLMSASLAVLAACAPSPDIVLPTLASPQASPRPITVTAATSLEATPSPELLLPPLGLIPVDGDMMIVMTDEPGLERLGPVADLVTEGFELEVTGAINSIMPPGVALWSQIPAVGDDPPYTMLSFSALDPHIAVSILLPDGAGAGTHRLSAGRVPRESALAHFTLIDSDTMIATDFTDDLNGTLIIEAISSNAISGRFDFTAAGPDDGQVHVSGDFSDLPRS